LPAFDTWEGIGTLPDNEEENQLYAAKTDVSESDYLDKTLPKKRPGLFFSFGLLVSRYDYYS
jgi:hypothetical protein